MHRVLIVDDEPQIRGILKVVLSEQGYDVETASSGEEAIQVHERFSSDVVLLDLTLPGINGVETLQQLRAQSWPPECIVITAHGSIASAVSAMRAGAFDYLTKPFDNDAIVLHVEGALRVKQLSAEVHELRGELEARYGFSDIIGISPGMQRVFRTIIKVASASPPVLISGESGTGKELVARAIHRRSANSKGPFVAVNCSAVPANLVESEFFGHEKGAFTDAHRLRTGKFEQANGGSIFLDEIGDLSLEAQVKLLRVLQEHQISRVGGDQTIPIDARVIAATHRNLEQGVADGWFREDLFWRIQVLNISLPPLKQRAGDLPILTDYLVERFCKELEIETMTVSPEARSLLTSYDWPGNVRELENTLQRAIVMADGTTMGAQDLPARIRGVGKDESDSSLTELTLSEAVRNATEDVERRIVRARLASLGGNRTATARSLGISRKTLYNKLQRLDEGEP